MNLKNTGSTHFRACNLMDGVVAIDGGKSTASSHLDTMVLMSLYPLHKIRSVAAADFFRGALVIMVLPLG